MANFPVCMDGIQLLCGDQTGFFVGDFGLICVVDVTVAICGDYCGGRVALLVLYQFTL